MTLDKLATELVLSIITHLNHVGLVAVELTCHRLRAVVQTYRKAMVLDKKFAMADLLEVEQWPAYNLFAKNGRKDVPDEALSGADSFACCQCLKIRDAIHFTTSMMRGPRGKHGMRARVASRRCVDCLMLMNMLPKAHVLTYGGSYRSSEAGTRFGVWCQLCFKFKMVKEGAPCPNRRCDECQAPINAKKLARLNYLGKPALPIASVEKDMGEKDLNGVLVTIGKISNLSV